MVRVGRLKVKALFAAIYFEFKIAISLSDTGALSLEIEELIQFWATLHPEFEVFQLDLKGLTLNQQSLTDVMQEKKPSSSI